MSLLSNLQVYRNAQQTAASISHQRLHGLKLGYNLFLQRGEADRPDGALV